MTKGIRSIKRGIAVLLSACMVFGMAPIQAGAEENDSEIAVQANDSAGKTEQQSTDEASVTINGEECKHEGVEITFNSNGFGNCPKCNATVYQPAVETIDKYDIDDDGTKDTVYEISNAGQLYWFADKVNNGETSLNAVLTADISVNEGDVSGCDGNKAEGWRDWTPIGSVSNKYSGTFDGQNHTVSGLYFNDKWANYVGLFGWSNGTIQNIGIICSYFYGYECVGGVCGITESTIRNCYNTGTVFGSSKTGGMCGYNDYGTIENCYNIGTVFGTFSKVGGVCGYNNNDTVTNCYYLDTCAAEGTTFDNTDGTSKTAEQFASGEVAYLLNGSKSEGDTVHFYQNLSGENADALPVLDKSHGVVYFYTDCTDKTCYANSETASGEHDFDENGFCTKDSTHYQPATLNETTGNYEISNAGQLYWFAGLVNGTLDGVEQNTSANAILTANITANENLLDSLQYDTEGNVANGSDFISWTPIADCVGDHITQYSGTFDGNNKTVSGLYFNDNSTRIGLFGSSEANGNIKNVGVVDFYFKGNDFVGGVCGRNDGTITNCYNAGNLTAIESSATIGGICGYNGGTITNCYNTGTVTATGSIPSVGGVCGCSIAPISNCYNTGTVTAASSGADISGICGYNYGPVTNCYYLADTEDENGGKTAAQFASGEIAYLLSQGCSIGEGDATVTYDGSIWGQALGENGDIYPVLKKAGDVENTVYRNETYQGCEGNKGEPVYSYSNTQEAPVYAEHTDEDLDGKCDICKLDFKTFKQLGLLIAKVNKNLSDGKYADVQYTTASIDNLRTALVAAGTITEASSDADVATAFDKLLAASTVGADGLIKADHNIVISFANPGAVRGIASGNGWYANGDTVTLKVTPSMGYSFGKWTKDTAGNTSVGTESTYTFTLDADSQDAYYAWLDEVKYTVTCESTEGGTCVTSTSDGKYVYGQTATVTATASDGYEFVGWKDSYGTTVSTDAIYSFTVLGDTVLTPEFVKVKTEEGNEIAYVTVSFYHQSGKLLDSRKVVSGEEKITTTVNAPTKVGFDFLGWSAKASGATAEDVVDFETATFSENTSLYPVFKAQDITYTLTVVGLQTEQKAPQSSVTVTADPIDGKQFVGWKDANGNIVSYDSTYTFIITGDTTLEACYEQADSVIVKEPTIIIGEPIISEKQQGVSKKATMYFNYDIPGENELVDIGVVYVSGKQNTLDMNTPGVVIRSAMSTINASPNNVKNQFYYSKTMTADSEYTFMGYIVYTDSSGKRITKYSDLKNASYND